MRLIIVKACNLVFKEDLVYALLSITFVIINGPKIEKAWQ